MPHNSAAITTAAKRDGIEDLIHDRIAASRSLPAKFIAKLFCNKFKHIVSDCAAAVKLRLHLYSLSIICVQSFDNLQAILREWQI